MRSSYYGDKAGSVSTFLGTYDKQHAEKQCHLSLNVRVSGVISMPADEERDGSE
jgi:hypothetical protein